MTSVLYNHQLGMWYCKPCDVYYSGHHNCNKNISQTLKPINFMSKYLLISEIVAKPKDNYLNDVPLSDSEFNELTEDIRKNGIRVPLLVQKKTNRLIDGFNRLSVAKKLKYDEVPVEYTDIKDSEIESTQYILQVSRRNLNPQDRKLIIGRLINLKKLTAKDATKLGMKEGQAKFAAKVADIVDKSGEKLSVKDAQKLVKVKGRKGAEEEAKKIKNSDKTPKQVIKEVVKEKKTKMTAHQVVEKPMHQFENAFDEYPQYQAEFKKILKSFLENL
jgi:ParB-like chromosome segregation protein Spo0J